MLQTKRIATQYQNSSTVAEETCWWN